jgi:hypothetical protein
MVAATKPRVTGGIEVRYWSGVDRMAIPRLMGHGNHFAPATSPLRCARMTCLSVFVRKRSRVVLRQPTLFSFTPSSPWPTTTFARGVRSSSRAVSRTEASSRSMSLFPLLQTMSQIIRKKKSKSKSRPDDVKEDRERVKELLSSEDVGSTPASASGSNRASPSLSNGNERKTDAERRFEEAQRRRVSLRLISPFIH